MHHIVNQSDKKETPNENGKLNSILIKTIWYNSVMMRKTSIFSNHSTPTEIRIPTLVQGPACVLLDPNKRGLRNPTLRMCKTQLARSMCNNQLHACNSKLHYQLHIKLHIYQVSKCPIKTSSSCSKPPKANLHVINQSNQVTIKSKPP